MKNEEMVAEGELRCNLDDSDKVRELQDKVADLKAEVMRLESWKEHWVGGCVTPRVNSLRSQSWDSDTMEVNDNLNDELRLQMTGLDHTSNASSDSIFKPEEAKNVENNTQNLSAEIPKIIPDNKESTKFISEEKKLLDVTSEPEKV